VLKARLYEAERLKVANEVSAERRTQVGTGERSEKIRTYNFPQNRVTDHRIQESWHNMPEIMDGNIKDILEEVKLNIGKKGTNDSGTDTD
jgi:peptide chain release factor 1